MLVTLDRSDVTSLEQALDRLAATEGVRSAIVLLAEKGTPPATDLDAMLSRAPLPIIGGVFPAVVFDHRWSDRGAVLIGLSAELNTVLVEHLSEDEAAVRAALADGLDPGALRDPTTVVFADATAEHLDGLLEGLFDRMGLLGSYLGGGAGSLSFQRRPCVFDNRGVRSDAAVVGVLDLPSCVGVAHGWQPVGAPLQITASSGRTVHELDHAPAAERYTQLVESHAVHAPDWTDFAAVAASYPLGIVKLDEEVVVRDPIARRGDALVCVGEIPQGAFVHLLHGDEASLLAAAAAVTDQLGGCQGGGTEVTLLLDCISRALFLGDRFVAELGTVAKGRTLAGALTIGEVCSAGDRFLELYNKTIVLASLCSSSNDARNPLG
ncbi:MAG: FIST signal transduction protein [Nitriliruptoraceae bacterium]